MRRPALRLAALLSVGLVLALTMPVRAEIAGAAGRPTTYGGLLELPDGGRCALSIQVERFSFLLTSVGGKYRFVRMLVDCQKPASLTLSSSSDRLEMSLEGASVPGVLSLQRSDSEIWDALDANMRQALAYPPAIRGGEPVYVFAYFPVESAQTMPREFSFTIASLSRTIELRHAATAARH